MKYIKSLFDPLPSIFDIFLGMFLLVFSINGNDNRSIFIAFYCIFLFALSIGMKPKREYKSVPLMLLTLWAFLGIFIHSFALSSKQITSNWKIIYLTTEGFIYILLGVVFIQTVVKYSTNPKFVYFLIPFAMLPMIPGMARLGSSTMLVALALSVVIYLFLSKKYIYGLVASVIGMLTAMLNWTWLCFKFRSRPVAIYQLVTNMFYNPVRFEGSEMVDAGVVLAPGFEKLLTLHAPWLLNLKPYLASIFGSGFSLYLNSDYKWVTLGDFKYGWVHKHNDYLNLANCLGPVVLIFVVWFIVDTLKIIGIRPVLILFMTVILVSMSQFTLYDPGKATICLTITALTITDGLTRRK